MFTWTYSVSLILISSCSLVCMVVASDHFVTLDEVAFRKVIPRFNESLVLFHGWASEDEIVPVSERYRHNDDILFAYVDANEDDAPLVKKLNIDVKNLPALRLYKDFGKKEIAFSGEWKTDQLMEWLEKNSGLRLTLPSCIASLDQMAESFIQSEPSSRAKILEEAKREAAKFSQDEEKSTSAKVYLKLMERIIERGDLFLASEESRVNNLMSSKITDAKKKELETRVNIIKSFKSKEKEPESEPEPVPEPESKPAEAVKEKKSNSGCGCSRGKSNKLPDKSSGSNKKQEL